MLLSLAVTLLGMPVSRGRPEGRPAWPPKARWHNNQGVVYMDQHNYTRGREEFARALALAPDYASARANLGIAYYALGKYDSAATALQTVLSIDPDLLHANYALWPDLQCHKGPGARQSTRCPAKGRRR